MTEQEQEYDTTEKVERTDKGYRVTIESTRGTGTRDQDKVKVEMRTESKPSSTMMHSLEKDVKSVMNERRSHSPDMEENNE